MICIKLHKNLKPLKT